MKITVKNSIKEALASEKFIDEIGQNTIPASDAATVDAYKSIQTDYADYKETMAKLNKKADNINSEIIKGGKQNKFNKNPQQDSITRASKEIDKVFSAPVLDEALLKSASEYIPSTEAEVAFDSIETQNALEDFYVLIDSLYPQGITSEELDNLLIHEANWIFDALGLTIDFDFDDDTDGVAELLGDLPEQNCILCGKPFTGYGNNPAPVSEEGVCCDYCNATKVIPARLNQARRSKNLDSTLDYFLESKPESKCELCEKSYVPRKLTKTNYGWLCNECIQTVKSYNEPISIKSGVNWEEEHQILEAAKKKKELLPMGGLHPEKNTPILPDKGNRGAMDDFNAHNMSAGENVGSAEGAAAGGDAGSLEEAVSTAVMAAAASFVLKNWDTISKGLRDLQELNHNQWANFTDTIDKLDKTILDISARHKKAKSNNKSKLDSPEKELTEAYNENTGCMPCDKIAFLANDELEAIKCYDEAILFFNDSNVENREEIVEKLQHIKEEELEHIRELKLIKSMISDATIAHGEEKPRQFFDMEAGVKAGEAAKRAASQAFQNVVDDEDKDDFAFEALVAKKLKENPSAGHVVNEANLSDAEKELANEEASDCLDEDVEDLNSLFGAIAEQTAQ